MFVTYIFILHESMAFLILILHLISSIEVRRSVANKILRKSQIEILAAIVHINTTKILFILNMVKFRHFNSLLILVLKLVLTLALALEVSSSRYSIGRLLLHLSSIAGSILNKVINNLIFRNHLFIFIAR